MSAIAKLMPFVFLVAMLFALPGKAEAQRTRLQARMSGNTLADGKAKFLSRRNRMKFSVEIEDAVANTEHTMTLVRSGAQFVLGTFTTNAAGFADFNQDTRNGNSVIAVQEGDVIKISRFGGVEILSGTFRRK